MEQLGLFPEKNAISLSEWASKNKLSLATARNWCKKLNIQPLKGRISDEQSSILTKELVTKRLSSRANKTKSQSKRIHVELGGKEAQNYINKYFSNLSNEECNQKIISICSHFDFLKDYQENGIWMEGDAFSSVSELDEFLNCLSEDFMGFVYLACQTDSEKNFNGKFYTPYTECKKYLRKFKDKKVKVFFEPCCGAGAFMLAAAEIFGSKIRIIGNDIDSIAVKIVEFNMKWFAPAADWVLSCEDFDASLLPPDSSETLVATNPPWGSQAVRGTNYSDFSTQVVQRLFLKLNAASFCFVLPGSLFEVQKHSKFRRLISSLTQKVEVYYVGKSFKGLQTEVAVIYVERSDGNPKSQFLRFSDTKGSCFSINKSKILSENGVGSFFIGNSDEFGDIWNKVKSTSTLNLADSSKFALGIVTGDNKKFLQKEPFENSEACCVGRDIESMESITPSSFIHFNPELFQQCAPESLLRSKSQVVYRFIADKIICTPASGEVLCLNSANLIVLDDSLPNWLIATLLQSSISQSFFRLNFNSTKVLKSHILSIPLPNLDNNTVLDLLSSYEDLKSRKISKEIYFEFVNSVVNQHFMLSDGELAMLTAR